MVPLQMAETSRRAFIKALTALVAAVAVPKVILDIAGSSLDPLPPAAPIIATDQPLAGGPLSLAQLEQAYWSCSYGYYEPNYILLSPSRYRELLQLLPLASRWHSADDLRSGKSRLVFNSAKLTYGTNLPDDHILMLNSDSSTFDHSERYSGMFTLPDIKWHPLEVEYERYRASHS